MGKPERDSARERSAGVPPATHGSEGVPPAKIASGGQDARPPFGCAGRDAFPPLVDPFSPIQKHEHHLPHWQQCEAAQFVTWRLADSIPREKLDLWKRDREAWARAHPQPWDDRVRMEYHRLFSNRLDEWLDAGAGSCVLRDPGNRRIVADALRFFDGERCDLWAFVVMPNHVHVLFSPRPPFQLEQVIQSWKSFTAKAINRRLGSAGALWQEDYWDRLVRSELHFHRCVRYIRENPVKGGLGSGEFTCFVREGSEGIVEEGSAGVAEEGSAGIAEEGSAGILPATHGSEGVPPAKRMHGGQDARPPLEGAPVERTPDLKDRVASLYGLMAEERKSLEHPASAAGSRGEDDASAAAPEDAGDEDVRHAREDSRP